MQIYALRMNGPLAVLDTLRGIQTRYGRKYCWPSQEKLLERLKTCHGIEITRRTLNYWLKDLQDRKLIHRIRRLTRGRFMSTAYYICTKAEKNVSKIRKIIGYAKRLRSIFPVSPYRVQNLAHNMNTETSGYEKSLSVAAPTNEPPAEFIKGSSILESWGLKIPGVMKKPS